MRIGLDLDGVTVDFNGRWRSLYEQWFDREVDEERIDEWDSIVNATHFEEESHFWTWAESVPGFWEQAPAIPGALGGILELLQAGHTIEIITNRHERARFATTLWVSDHWPMYGQPPRLHMLRGDKAVIDVQVYIEDNPRRIRELVKAGKPNVIVFDQPWNQEELPGTIRARSWHDVVGYIEVLAAGGDPRDPVAEHGIGAVPESQAFDREDLVNVA